jgi:branched-chain amino acid transport system permease protein
LELRGDDMNLQKLIKKPIINPQPLSSTGLFKDPKFWVFIVLSMSMYILPQFIETRSTLLLLTNIFILAVFAMSYDILLGYTGIISFGHAMFFGIGAYSMALSIRHFESPEVGIILAIVFAVVVSFVVSIVVGFLSLRLRDTFYALITLAVATIFVVTAEQWRSLTRGNDGFNFTASIPKDLFGFINLLDREVVYYLSFSFLLIMFLVLRQFISSPVGRVLQAIRENEERTESLGYNVLYYKVISNVVAGLVASLAGIMYAISIRFVSPDSALGVDITIDALLMTIIGGVGTLYGAILGAGVIELASHWLMDMRDVHPIFERWVILFGFVFVITVLFFPLGIVGTIRQKWNQRKSGATGKE